MRTKIIFLSLFFFTLYIPVNANRLIQSFNDGWYFADCNLNSLQEIQNSNPEWEQIHLPHTWNKDAYSTRNYTRGSSWYKKEFMIPSSQIKERQIFLKFDAINSLADVYLNGKLLTTHKGGYSAFIIDITNYLMLDTKNLLMIRANNKNNQIPPLSGDFTIFGGIYRNAWLISTSKQHFSLTNYASTGIFVDTPIVSEEKSEIRVRGTLKNEYNENSSVVMDIDINDMEGKTVFRNSKSLKLKADKELDFLENITLQNPKLWSPESPYLYKISVKLHKSGSKDIIDQINIPLGIRWFSVDTKEGFKLNGKPLKLMGVCRHQDQKPMGIALSDEMHRRDMKLIKDMGANFLRLAHYPQDESVLRACDELGLLVWEEIPVVDLIALGDEFRNNATSALKEMIRQHYNHPSIIMWRYMNEAVIQLQYKVKKQRLNGFYENTLSLARHLEETLKSEDKFRLSTMAYHDNQIYNRIGLSNITDISGWNLYQGWYENEFTSFDRFVDEEHKKYPNRPLIISEFGAGSDPRLQSLEPQIFDFSMQWQQMFLEYYLPAIMKRDFIIGATEWNFIDFSSASRQEATPHINNKGLLYNDRRPKDVFYYFQAFLRKDIPVLHIATEDWKYRTVVSDGDPVIHPIKVYSNLKSVSMQVNGQKLTEQTLKNCNAQWNVSLTSGRNVLEVSGIYNGKVISKVSEIYVKMQPKQTANIRNEQLELAVNVGSNCYFTDDKSGLCWLPDKEYTPGSWGYIGGENYYRSPQRIGTTAEIKNTRNVPLLQTKRKDIEAYRFDLPNGEYEVELLFADLNARYERLTYDLGSTNALSDTNFKGNIFNVSVNNRLWLENFSPGIEVGGNQCISKKIRTIVTDGKIVIDFAAVKGMTFLNAIKICRIL